jgi:short-subunit dehydrogenase
MSKVSVKNLVVFVTGCSRKRGIGRALCEEAIKRGAKKVYATGRDVSQLKDLVAKFQGKVEAVELDVTNPEQIKRATEKASDTQVLINNAGMAGFSGCCCNYNEETARQQLEVNYFGPLHLMRAFSDSLVKNKGGAIVNVISVAGLLSFPLAATYSASKAALHSLTQSVRAEMMPKGVSVFGVYPGPIDTDMSDGLEVKKEAPAHAALRVFDGLEQGNENITTDAFADAFVSYLREDLTVVEAIEKEFDQLV